MRALYIALALDKCNLPLLYASCLYSFLRCTLLITNMYALINMGKYITKRLARLQYHLRQNQIIRRVNVLLREYFIINESISKSLRIMRFSVYIRMCICEKFNTRREI